MASLDPEVTLAYSTILLFSSNSGQSCRPQKNEGVLRDLLERRVRSLPALCCSDQVISSESGVITQHSARQYHTPNFLLATQGRSWQLNPLSDGR